MLDREVRQEFLRLLREDEEFRYAVAGYLGLSEILKRLEEHDRKFNEILKKLEEHGKRLEEHDRKFNEILARLEEHDRKFNEIMAVLREHDKSLKRLEASLGSLGSRIGIDLEKTILSIYSDVLSRFGIVGERVEKISIKDVEGRYYRKGAKLELDIYVHNDKVFFVEVKSFADEDDVEWFETRCEIFEKILGRKPDGKIFVAINILRDAFERAKELGIDVVYGNVIEIKKD